MMIDHFTYDSYLCTLYRNCLLAIAGLQIIFDNNELKENKAYYNTKRENPTAMYL